MIYQNKRTPLFALPFVLSLLGCDDGSDNVDTVASTTTGGSSTGDVASTDTPPGTTTTGTTTTGTSTGSDTQTDTDQATDTDPSTDTDTDGDTDTGIETCDPGCENGQVCIDAVCLDQEPAYPRPTAEGCPPGFLESESSNTCIPPCDPQAPDNIAACPQASSGRAIGFCVVGGEVGVGGDCETYGVACEMEGEFCIDNLGMGLTCIAATHCGLFCGAGESCPNSMMCSDQGLCVYG